LRNWWIPVQAVFLRDLRKYRRWPSLIVASLVLPILQLLVMGYAIGGSIQDVPVVLLDLDGGVVAWDVYENLLAVQATTGSYELQRVQDEPAAMQALALGKCSAVVVIPRATTEAVARGEPAKLTVLMDNADLVTRIALGAEFARVGRRLESLRADRLGSGSRRISIIMEGIDAYPHTEYFDYLSPGAIAVGLYLACMIGGGLIYVDDKANGIAEGYLASPIGPWQFLAGIVMAGTLKAFLTGFLVMACALAITGSWFRIGWETWIPLMGFLALTALAIVTFTTMLCIRLRSVLLGRAFLVVLSMMLYFPSGAVYPVSSFPPWLQAWARIDPFTYGVHGLRVLLFKGYRAEALASDALALGICALLSFCVARLLFTRTIK